jgi:hypothetical protein
LELLSGPGRAGEGLLARSVRATPVLVAPMGCATNPPPPAKAGAPGVKSIPEPNTIIARALFTFPYSPELKSKIK